MKYRSYKQITVHAEIEYGDEVNLEEFINQIDWKKAILFGVEFGDQSFLSVGDEDCEGKHMVWLRKPRKQSGWKRILGKFEEKTARVNSDKLMDKIVQYWKLLDE